MARSRSAQKCKIKWYLSRKLDCKEGRFIQLGNSLLLSKEYQSMSWTAKHLYICLAMEAGGKDQTEFSHSAAKKYGFPSSTFDRAIRELQENGFILLVLDEARSQFKTNVYRFCHSWKSKSAPHSGEDRKTMYPQNGYGQPP